MTVLIMDCAPESVRGELDRWFVELKPGVFIGKINARIRELLWERICKTPSAKGSVMAYSMNTEQGFKMQMFGEPKRYVVDFEGIQLIAFPQNEENNQKCDKSLDTLVDCLPDDPFESSFIEVLNDVF